MPTIPQPVGTNYNNTRYLDSQRVPLALNKYPSVRAELLKVRIGGNCGLIMSNLVCSNQYINPFQEVDRLWPTYVNTHVRVEKELLIRST